MSSVVPGSAFGRAAEQSGGAGVPLVMLFERDDAVAVPLLTQLRMAGYDVRAARTPVELFDTLRKHAVALILVDLGSAAVSRREFWVALDSQRRGRAIQIVTFRTGVGPRMSEPDLELSARALADVISAAHATMPGSSRTCASVCRSMARAWPSPPSSRRLAPRPAILASLATARRAMVRRALARPPTAHPPMALLAMALLAWHPAMAFLAMASLDSHPWGSMRVRKAICTAASPACLAWAACQPRARSPPGGAYPPHGAPASNGTGIAPSSPFAQPAAANPFAGPTSPPTIRRPRLRPQLHVWPILDSSPGTPGPASSPFAQPYSSNPFGSNPPGSQPSATNPGGASPFASTPAGGGAFGGTAFGGNPLGGNLFGAAFPSANPFGSTPNGSNPFGTNLGNIFGSTPSSASHPSAPGAPSSRPGTGAPLIRGGPDVPHGLWLRRAPAGGAALGMRDALGARGGAWRARCERHGHGRARQRDGSCAGRLDAAGR